MECTPDRIRSIPLKAFLQCINDNPNCIYHNQTRNLYKNWSSHVIASEEGNLLKCIFNDADGTVKMLIREDLFNMVESSIAASWRTVAARPSDEDFANKKGKRQNWQRRPFFINGKPPSNRHPGLLVQCALGQSPALTCRR